MMGSVSLGMRLGACGGREEIPARRCLYCKNGEKVEFSALNVYDNETEHLAKEDIRKI